MKAMFVYAAIFAVLVLLIPLFALQYDLPRAEIEADIPVMAAVPLQPVESAASEEGPQVVEEESEASADASANEEAALFDLPESTYTLEQLKVLDESTGNVLEVPLRDYVRGAVAAEMPAAFHLEALKAQAVAAHTYALHNHLMQQESPDPALQSADFSADTTNLKVFMNEEQVREFYGDGFEEAWARICEAADAALPYVLEYEDEPIVAAYHSISAGRTEDAANVWSGSAPYLVSADSEGDLLAPGYETTVALSTEEVRALLSAAVHGIALDEDPDLWFGSEMRSEAGYVTSIQVGDQQLHGKDIRQIFGLRSHNFEVEYSDAGFTFAVYGYGHGVGLSQYGADYLARQGYTFDQILSKYYQGAVLKQVELSDDV